MTETPTPKRKQLPIVGNPAPPAEAAERPKRRLPVLPSASEDDDDDEERPPWHWSGIGLVTIFLVWLPLSSLINTPIARLLRTSGAFGGTSSSAGATAGVPLLMIALNALGFALAAFAGGFLVGRFGGRAGAREATLSGFLAAAVAWTVSFLAAPKTALAIWFLLLATLAALGGGATYLGGRLGHSLRK